MNIDGLILDDWKVVRVSDLCRLQRGFDITEATRVAGSVPVYSSSGISYFHARAAVQPPAVVTGRKGLLGRVFYVDEPFWPHDTTLWADDFNGNDPRFVAAVLAAFHLERLDAATSVPTLNRNNLTAYELMVPLRRVEQAKIAAVILEADTLIEALEKLIAKKRDVKQGMMQELLTGRTRLPGFTGEWQVLPVGEVATVVMGQSPSGSSYNTKANGVVLVQGNADIENRRTFDRVWTTSPSKRVRKGDVVLTVRAPVGFTARAHADACLGRGVCGLSTTDSTDFLFHALVAAEDKWALFEQGSTFTAVNSDQVRAFEIDWAMDIVEREVIAAVLNDADTEIQALERRMESARAVKVGMMQELLTGRTRLPVEDDA